MTRARTDAVLAAAVTLAVLVGLVGCGQGEAPGPVAAAVVVAGGPTAEAAAVAEARQLGEAERARLAARLEALERRLLEGRARVAAWRELQERHRQVASVARDDRWHVADMLRAREEERNLVRAIRAPRLASAGRADGATGAP